jgi:predicted NBD/HSP70 family sugar kinase
LAGNILTKSDFPTSPDIKEMNRQILAKVGKLAGKYKNYNLEVGISIPGVADQSSGSILYVPYFQWSNWDIGTQVEQKIGLPVTIDNDANAVALAELWFGADEIRTTRNLVEVMIAEGIGTGIIIDGQIYRGQHGAAGEFGHMFVGNNAPVTCSCGRRDCWEAHASEKAIINQYFTNSNGGRQGLDDIDYFIAQVEAGDQQARKILKNTAHYIGIGISNLIIGFSPQAVVVSGSIVRVWDLIKSEIQELAQRSIRHELPIRTTILPSTLGDEPTILGSVTLVLSRKFASATS